MLSTPPLHRGDDTALASALVNPALRPGSTMTGERKGPVDHRELCERQCNRNLAPGSGSVNQISGYPHRRQCRRSRPAHARFSHASPNLLDYASIRSNCSSMTVFGGGRDGEAARRDSIMRNSSGVTKVVTSVITIAVEKPS